MYFIPLLYTPVVVPPLQANMLLLGCFTNQGDWPQNKRTHPQADRTPMLEYRYCLYSKTLQTSITEQ